MAEHLLAIDDVAEDFEDILQWAIEFKRMWKSGDEIAMNFSHLQIWQWAAYMKAQH